MSLNYGFHFRKRRRVNKVNTTRTGSIQMGSIQEEAADGVNDMIPGLSEESGGVGVNDMTPGLSEDSGAAYYSEINYTVESASVGLNRKVKNNKNKNSLVHKNRAKAKIPTTCTLVVRKVMFMKSNINEDTYYSSVEAETNVYGIGSGKVCPNSDNTTQHHAYSHMSDLKTKQSVDTYDHMPSKLNAQRHVFSQAQPREGDIPTETEYSYAAIGTT